LAAQLELGDDLMHGKTTSQVEMIGASAVGVTRYSIEIIET